MRCRFVRDAWASSKEDVSRRRGRELHTHVGKEEHDGSRGVRRGACVSVKRASVFAGINCEAACRTGTEGSSKLKTCKRLRPPGRQVLVWSASACVHSRHSAPQVSPRWDSPITPEGDHQQKQEPWKLRSIGADHVPLLALGPFPCAPDHCITAGGVGMRFPGVRARHGPKPLSVDHEHQRASRCKERGSGWIYNPTGACRNCCSTPND